MKAAIYHDIRNVTVEEVPDPVPGEKDAVVKVARCGLCGSDMTAWRSGGMFVGIDKDAEFGHEFCGTISQVGSAVEGVAVGDRVVVRPDKAKRQGLSMADMAGGFSEYVNVEDAAYGYNIYKIPDDVSFDEVVIAEPFWVGTRAVNRTEPTADTNMVIYGAGPIGLCALAAAVAKGITPVVIDVVDERLEYAKEIGGIPFNSTQGDVNEFLIEQFGATENVYQDEVGKVDAWVDAAGVPSVIEDIMDMCKVDGSILSVVAIHKDWVEINMTTLVTNELEIRGSCSYHTPDIEEVLDNLFSRRTKIGKIITHRFAQKDIAEAFDTFERTAETGAMKVIIDYDM